jgi:hypothetical protein
MYDFCLKAPEYAYVREKIEAMWARYEPYCPDEHFLSEARRAFHERTWEMRLACVLLDRGLPLVRPGPKGPDLCIDGSPRVWVEAIAVGAGESADRVPDRAARAFTEEERGYRDDELPDAGWHGEPPSEDSLILRATEALDKKTKAYLTYRRDGIVKPGEPYIVAISLTKIDDAFYRSQFDDVPVFLQALFGIGAEHIRLSTEPAAKDKLFRPHRPFVTKAGGAKISTLAFASPSHPEISGVFGSCTDIVNVPSDPGREIMFVNNPRAAAPVPPGTFRFGMEFVASEDGTGKGKIEPCDHRTPYDRDGWTPLAD